MAEANAGSTSDIGGSMTRDYYIIEYTPQSYNLLAEDRLSLEQLYNHILTKANLIFAEIEEFLNRQGDKVLSYMNRLQVEKSRSQIWTKSNLEEFLNLRSNELTSYKNHLQVEKSRFQESLKIASEMGDWFGKKSKLNGCGQDLILIWRAWDVRLQHLYYMSMDIGSAESSPLLSAQTLDLVELRKNYRGEAATRVLGYSEFDFPECIRFIREERLKTYRAVQIYSEHIVSFYSDRPNTLIASALELLHYNGEIDQSCAVKFIGHIFRGFKPITIDRTKCQIVRLGVYEVKSFFVKEFLVFMDKCQISKSQFISSLSHCKVWGAQGGKTKSLFLKTEDERMIIKGINRIEFEYFLQVAEDYINYMSSRFQDDTCPLLLSKIFGLYEVSMKHSKQYLIIMENTLFEKVPNIIYDIKGTILGRNRREADLLGGVRFDLNFREDVERCGLLFDAASKDSMEAALETDTQFLMEKNIMDYSLLLGFDVEHKVMTCSIIDFLRPYTYDKKCERVVKSIVKCKTPTVVPPVTYRTRLIEFIKPLIRGRPAT